MFKAGRVAKQSQSDPDLLLLVHFNKRNFLYFDVGDVTVIRMSLVCAAQSPPTCWDAADPDD